MHFSENGIAYLMHFLKKPIVHLMQKALFSQKIPIYLYCRLFSGGDEDAEKEDV